MGIDTPRPLQPSAFHGRCLSEENKHTTSVCFLFPPKNVIWNFARSVGSFSAAKKLLLLLLLPGVNNGMSVYIIFFEQITAQSYWAVFI